MVGKFNNVMINIFESSCDLNDIMIMIFYNYVKL